MKCKKCSSSLKDNAIFCPTCGWQTDFLKDNLSAKLILSETWQEYKGIKGKNYPFAIFYVLAIMLPVALAAFFTRNNYWINNLAMLIAVPFALIPLTFGESIYSIKMYVQHLIYYPKMFAVTLFTILFYFLINVICTGNPLFYYATDPILHPVRLVLVLYWLAIIVPVFYLIAKEGKIPCKALIISYKAGQETRWQQFFLVVVLAFFNVVALIPAGLGLLFTIPFSFLAIRKFSERLDEKGIFEPVMNPTPVTEGK